MSWRDIIARIMASKLPMDEASRMERARRMGFDVDNPLYASTLDAPSSFKSHGAMGHKGLGGVSLTDNPEAASRYLDRYGDYNYRGEPFNKSMMKVFVRPGEVRQIEQPLSASALMGQALPEGYQWPKSLEGVDTAVFPDVVTKRGAVRHPTTPPKSGVIESNEYVLRDPSRIRSAFAAFDPDKIGSSDLLAGIAALGAVPVTLGAFTKQDDYDAVR